MRNLGRWVFGLLSYRSASDDLRGGTSDSLKLARRCEEGPNLVEGVLVLAVSSDFLCIGCKGPVVMQPKAINMRQATKTAGGVLLN